MWFQGGWGTVGCLSLAQLAYLLRCAGGQAGRPPRRFGSFDQKLTAIRHRSLVTHTMQRMTKQQVKEAIAEWLADLDSPVDYSALEQRFWALTSLNPSDPQFANCIRWLGSHTSNGRYGVFTIKAHINYAHRIAVRIGYPQVCAPRALAPDLTVDHVRSKGCVHTDCVNPLHLEVVDRSTNSARVRNLAVFT